MIYVKESTYYAKDIPKIQLTTVVTPQGQNGIVNMLRKMKATV